MIRNKRFKNLLTGLVTGTVLATSLFLLQPAAAQFSPTYEFFQALKKEDYNGVKSNIMKGANVNARDDDGRTPLIIATDMDNPALVKYLLEQGAHVDDTMQGSGETALMRAAANGDQVMVAVLLFYKADINAQDQHGETPLMKAIRAGHPDAVKLLLQSGADVTLQDYTGNSAVDYAKVARQRSITKMVLDAASKK